MLKRKRQVLGLTQTQLAHIVGVNQSMIAHLEAGNVNPSERLLDRLVVALEVLSPAELGFQILTRQSRYVRRVQSHQEAL